MSTAKFDEKKATAAISGKKKSDALEILIRDFGLSFAASDEFYKKSGSRSSGVSGEFYDLLRKGRLSDEDFDAWISTKSDNVRLKRKYWEGLKDLVNGIRDDLAQ